MASGDPWKSMRSLLGSDYNNLPIQSCWFLQYPKLHTFISCSERYSHHVSIWEILFLLQSKIFAFLHLLQHIILCSQPSPPSLELFLTFTILKSVFDYILCYNLLDLFCLFFSIFTIFLQLEYKILEEWPWIFSYFIWNMLEEAIFVWFNHVECRNNPESVTVNVEWAKKCWRPDTIFECQEQWPWKRLQSSTKCNNPTGKITFWNILLRITCANIMFLASFRKMGYNWHMVHV